MVGKSFLFGDIGAVRIGERGGQLYWRMYRFIIFIIIIIFFFFFFFSVRIPGTITALKGPSFKGGLLPIGKTEDRDSIRSKVFGGEGEGFGEGKRGLSPESPLFPSPIFPPRTKEQRPGGGDGALQRKEEDTVSVRRRMTLPLNEQTQLGTCETVRWNRSFKVVEALVYVNGFADYCFP